MERETSEAMAQPQFESLAAWCQVERLERSRCELFPMLHPLSE